jgi:hypothetical protein
VGYGNIVSIFPSAEALSTIVKFTLILMLSCGQRSALSTGETRTLSDELGIQKLTP